MKKFLTGAALAVVLSSPAFAADMVQSPEPAPAPMATPAPSFDWTGFYVGGQLGYNWATSVSPGGNDSSLDSGLNAGYNYDLGNWVVGVEGSYDWTNDNFGTGTGIDGIAQGKIKVGADLGRTLLYGTGGVAYARGDSSGNKVGYVVGAGVDFAATDHIIVGAEYDFNSFTGIDPVGTDANVHQFTARIGYKF